MNAQNSHYKVDLVIPCYNESAVLPQTSRIILTYMRQCLQNPNLAVASFRVLFVDDGSTDSTWSTIVALAESNREVVGIKLSRNFGHQNALLAGLSHADADVSISLDADLQDDIDVIADMLKAYQSGNDLALGVRTGRNSDTAFKRCTANLYYRMLSVLGVSIVQNHADFRLMSRRALQALLAHEEVNLFLRGLVPSIGFSMVLIPYSRRARMAGETKYSVPRMLKLALDGVTSFSVTPLRMVTVSGAILSGLALTTGVWVLLEWFFFPKGVVPGWASILLPLVFLAGMQLLSTGILGEYIGKIYMEVKRRPRFIEETLVAHQTARAGSSLPPIKNPCPLES